MPRKRKLEATQNEERILNAIDAYHDERREKTGDKYESVEKIAAKFDVHHPLYDID